jgi:hypothetical protein
MKDKLQESAELRRKIKHGAFERKGQSTHSEPRSDRDEPKETDEGELLL